MGASGAAPQEWGGNGAVAVLRWQGRVGIAAVLLGAAGAEEMLSLCAAWCTRAGEDCCVRCISRHWCGCDSCAAAVLPGEGPCSGSDAALVSNC